MAHEPLGAVLEFLHKISATKEMHDLADADLLQRFVASREEAAFTVLVRRHGPMVLAVCRRLLGDVHSAEDAFQATFMVLVRKATSVRRQAPLANWLYGVAQRVALKARTKAAAQQSRQRELTDMPSEEPLDDLTWQELRPILDEEIGKLPQKYRAPIVLCYLEGKTQEQAAQELGCPRGSLSSRLDVARKRLREKLTRRGLALSVGALTTALAEKSAGASVGAMLTINTAKAAASLAAGTAAAGTILSAQVIALMEEAMKGMIMMKVKMVVAVVACTLVVGGAGVAGYRELAEIGPVESTRQGREFEQKPAQNKEALPELPDWLPLQAKADAQAKDAKKSPDSNWTFGPTLGRSLICPSGTSSPSGNEALRLEDGALFNLPKKPANGKEDLSPEKLEKWYNETKVNLVIDYRKETDQWELKLRNVKFAELANTPTGSSKEWKTPSANELQERFSKLEWRKATNVEADQKEKGFYSLVCTEGMNPPMTFAFETSDGHRGVLQFVATNKTANRRDAVIRYKMMQQVK